MHDSYAALLDDDTLSNLNIFPMCICQTQTTYCIVLRDECDNPELAINAQNRLKYLYWSHSQWDEYPLVYNISSGNEYGEYLLRFQVDDELIDEIMKGFLGIY